MTTTHLSAGQQAPPHSLYAELERLDFLALARIAGASAWLVARRLAADLLRRHQRGAVQRALVTFNGRVLTDSCLYRLLREESGGEMSAPNQRNEVQR